MAIERHYATVSEEGQTGIIRGKFPTNLVRVLKANSGDVIMIETQGKTIVGGHVLSGKEADRVRRERAAETPARRTPADKPKKTQGKTKTKVAPKSKVKQTSAPAKTKVKGNKRKTRVDYDEPTKMRRPKTKKKISFGKKR
jgi:hypothetical protein